MPGANIITKPFTTSEHTGIISSALYNNIGVVMCGEPGRKLHVPGLLCC